MAEDLLSAILRSDPMKHDDDITVTLPQRALPAA
jgi:hypothetical protein